MTRTLTPTLHPIPSPHTLTPTLHPIPSPHTLTLTLHPLTYIPPHPMTRTLTPTLHPIPSPHTLTPTLRPLTYIPPHRATPHSRDPALPRPRTPVTPWPRTSTRTSQNRRRTQASGTQVQETRHRRRVRQLRFRGLRSVCPRRRFHGPWVRTVRRAFAVHRQLLRWVRVANDNTRLLYVQTSPRRLTFTLCPNVSETTHFYAVM